MWNCRSQCPVGLKHRSVAAEVVGSNTAGGVGVCTLSVVCCQVEVSATSCSLVQRYLTDCDV
jgi:hypothetical protein